MRLPRPPRPVAPAVRRIAVPRAFVIDFNRVQHFYDWTEAQIAQEKERIRTDAGAMADIVRLARVLRALEQVARASGWTEDETHQWRAGLRRPGTERDYILTLAMAVQHGYRQTADNQYQRLSAWLYSQGLNPILSDGDA